MSIKLMAQVWELQLTHAEQALLLALADHAHDDGTKCYPGVRYLSWKTGYSERQVQRILSQLERRDVILRAANLKGGRTRRTGYVITLEKGDKKSPFVREERVTSEALKGDTTGQKGDIATSPEPSKNHRTAGTLRCEHCQAETDRLLSLADAAVCESCYIEAAV